MGELAYAHSQDDVDEQITAASRHYTSCCWREQNGDLLGEWFVVSYSQFEPAGLDERTRMRMTSEDLTMAIETSCCMKVGSKRCGPCG